MEESIIMYSTELIKKFPTNPDRPITFVVYKDDYIDDAKFLIGSIHGFDYLDEHVTVVAINDAGKTRDPINTQVWIDPTVYQYMNSWAN